MRRLLLFLFAVAGLLGSPATWAALCSDIFPQDATPAATARLDLSIMNGQSYALFPEDGIAYSGGGDFYYRTSNQVKGLNTYEIISVTPGEPVRIFVEGDLDLAAHAEINPNGNAADLLIVVRGNLNIGTKNDINALVYVTGNVEANPDATVVGALTAEGTIETKVKDILIYDREAAEQFASGEVCTVPGDARVDHFELVFATPSLSCEPIPVRVRACADAGCSATLALTESITLTPADRWIGGAVRAFDNSDSLVAQLTRTAGEVVLGVEDQPYRCSPDDCRMQIRDSGFRVRVPTLIANRPSALGGEQAYIQAVSTDDETRACIADDSFAGQSKVVRLWSSYIEPGSGSESVSVNDAAIGTAQSGATGVSLNFDGQARAVLDVRYADAGQLRLNASYVGSTGEDGLDMQALAGNGLFVSQPAGFCIVPQATCPLGDSSCPAFRKVGETFGATIRPVAWESAADADFCAGNRTTPNYRQTGLQLAPVLVQPAGGTSGAVLVPASRVYDHVPADGTTGWNGEIGLEVAFSEVGVFRLGVTPPPGQYFGSTVAGGSSAPIGRFYPTHLRVEGDAGLAPACSTFSYQDQPIDVEVAPVLTITGQGLLPTGQAYDTLNYDHDGFWGIASPPAGLWLARERETDISARLLFDDSVEIIGAAGDGARSYRWTGDSLAYARGEAPGADDAPFAIRQRFTQAELTDGDGVCHRLDGAGACLGYDLDYSGSQIRLGRVRAENVIAAPLGSPPVAPMPLWLEHWSGAAFTAATDSCTQVQYEADPALTFAYSGNLGEAAVVQPVALADRLAQVQALQWTGSPLKGAVAVKHLLTDAGSGLPAHWLCREGAPTQGGVCTFGRNADGSVSQARADATATFGLFEGRAPLIFRREVYR